MDISGLGKLMMIGGAVLLVVGALFALGGKIPFLGRLPGDIFVQRKGYSFYFPIATCIVLSLLGSLILHFLSKK